MNPLVQQIEKWGYPRLLVVGDLMLDRYTWGDAERVSPEAPVLVLTAATEEVRLGGAASVAALLRGLEAEVSLAGVIGEDANGRVMRTLLNDDSIDDSLVFCDSDRHTTTKDRFMGQSASSVAQQILRVDHEQRNDIPAELEKRLFKAVSDALSHFAAVLISDYAKGVCTEGLLRRIILEARHQDIPVLVDPGRGVNFDRYRGSTVVKANRLEAQEAAGSPIRSQLDAVAVGELLCAKHALDAVLVTLDRDGIVVCRADQTSEQHPTGVRQVCDITGAGDMVLATVAFALAQGMTLSAAARLANFAAGMEVERQGVTVVSRGELLQALGHDKVASKNASRSLRTGPIVLSLDDAARIAAHHRQCGRTVVLTNGCFDLLHIGHVTYLQDAAELGDVLFVAINSDTSVQRLKGQGRPLIPQHDRAAMLAALASVDHVIVFEEDTPHRLLQAIRPDVLVKGGTTVDVIGREVVEAYGGRVHVVGRIADVSTTQLVSHIKESTCV